MTENKSDDFMGMTNNSLMQNCILGGMYADGSDATTDLTYLILETWNELELVNPVMSVRFSPNAPEKLYETVARIANKGFGDPVMYADKNIVPGLVQSGIPIEDARCYSNDGCWESIIPGKTSYTVTMLNVLHQIECVMNRGKSVLRDQMEGWDMGDPRDFESFEEFYQAYLTCVTRMIDLVIDSRRNNYKYVQLIAPDAFMSCFVDDCIEKGLEMNDGGARYKYGHISLGGLSDAVDCLAAVKKFVYDDKLITMDELITACRTNYRGQRDAASAADKLGS